jgi:transcriptional regulator with XRE-family HTH domain
MRLEVKNRLMERGMTVKDLAQETGISYDRLIHILNGFREAREQENEALQAFMEKSDETTPAA